MVEKVYPSGDRCSWEYVAAMNEARHDAFGVAMNGKIFAAGGLQNDGPFYTVLNGQRSLLGFCFEATTNGFKPDY